MKTEKIYQGNCIEVLKDFPDESIDCVVTSPPYWGLRDYNEEEQLGLEETPEEFVANLVKVFSEVKRVLKSSGTVWLNLGDSYAMSSMRGKNSEFKGMIDQSKQGIVGVNKKIPQGLKAKDLVGIPWRVALALQSDGWYLRQDIIWHKPNPMPESVQDRCTKSHEYIFLLTKSPKYFYDIDAVREPFNIGALKRIDQNIKKQIGSKRGNGGLKPNGNMKAVGDQEKGANKKSVWKTKYGSVENESKHRQGMHKQRGESVIVTRKELPEQKEFVDFIRKKSNAKKLSEDSGVKLSKVEHWFRYDESGFAYPSIEDWDKIREYLDDWSKEFISIDTKMTELETHLDSINNNPKGKNKRSVWKITTKPYKEAHFATFPIELPITCIKAGCPEGGIVLDPFFGSGTTGLAAQELHRHWVGIELNPEYIEIANRRVGQTNLFV